MEVLHWSGLVLMLFHPKASFCKKNSLSLLLRLKMKMRRGKMKKKRIPFLRRSRMSSTIKVIRNTYSASGSYTCYSGSFPTHSAINKNVLESHYNIRYFSFPLQIKFHNRFIQNILPTSAIV